MGVGRPEHKQDVHKWVLNDFSQADKKDWLERLIEALCDEAETLADADYARYASRIAYLCTSTKTTTIITKRLIILTPALSQ